MTSPAPRAEIGVIGGSGFYTFLDDPQTVEVATPFGPPSEHPLVGTAAGRSVAFLPRHGRDHRLAPHRVDYRANLWALRAVGVRQVLAPCAVGSLRPELGPGTVVVPDQVVDRTWGRRHTIYEDGAVHAPMADPYCPQGRAAVLDAGRRQDDESRLPRTQTASPPAPADVPPVVDGGTMVVVNGPRFSTRAESAWHAGAGWSLIGMTGMPEAAIARELLLCYTSVALVTDLDAGLGEGEGVTHVEVLEVFARNLERLRRLLRSAIGRLPRGDGDDGPECSCRHALDGQRLPFALP